MWVRETVKECVCERERERETEGKREGLSNASDIFERY